jgi:hypothetical protein
MTLGERVQRLLRVLHFGREYFWPEFEVDHTYWVCFVSASCGLFLRPVVLSPHRDHVDFNQSIRRE